MNFIKFKYIYSREFVTRSLFLIYLIGCYSYVFPSEFRLVSNELYGCYPIKVFSFFGIACWNEYLFSALFTLFIIFSVLVILGWYTKWSLGTLFCIFLLFRGQVLSHSRFYLNDTIYVPHNDNIIAIVLFIMVLSMKDFSGVYLNKYKKNKNLEDDSLDFYILLSISLVYFVAFLAKMRQSGLAWADGYSLRYYMLESYLLFDNSLALLGAKNLMLNLIGSWFALFFEATFFLTLFFKKIRIPYMILGLFFHSVLCYTLNANFYIGFLATYVIIFTELIYVKPNETA